MRSLVIGLVLLLPVAREAQMPSSSRPVQLVVSGGLQVPTGDFGAFHDAGVHANVSVLVRALGIRLRPELGYSRFNLKDNFDLPSLRSQLGGRGGAGGRRDLYDDALSTMLSGFANIELPLGSGSFQPFLLGGLGAVRLASQATTGSIEINDIQASINLGAGVRFRLGAISGMIEARMNNVPSTDTRAFFSDVRTIPVTFGLVF
jgi:hypothetical protein